MGLSNTGKTDHRLKINPEYYDDVRTGRKPWELRKNDRDFKEGDTVRLEWFDPREGYYSGSSFVRKIGLILYGPLHGVREGFCVFTVINEY